jgi:hypothetical protein
MTNCASWRQRPAQAMLPGRQLPLLKILSSNDDLHRVPNQLKLIMAALRDVEPIVKDSIRTTP